MISLLQHHKIDKTQKQVDFVVPFLDLDRKYFVDPSLLRFSKTPLIKKWNQEIEDFIVLINQVIRSGNYEKLNKLLNIGEAQNVGLGYCGDGIDGNGFGKTISKNITKIIEKNPDFKTRGFTRIEELQWLDTNVGPDRISDLVIHILKRDLIKYTKSQAKLLGIPTEEVRVQKVFMPDTLEWAPQNEKLPINPLKKVRDLVNPHPAILLVPKEIVKPLPLFLNYDDFYGYIESENPNKNKKTRKVKLEIVRKVIENPKKSAEYIAYREAEKEKLYRPDFDKEILEDLEKLETLEPGRKDANEYRSVVARLLAYVFEDELKYYKEEKQTHLGDMQRDIIFQNIAKKDVFADFRTLHSSSHIVVDAKNTEDVTAKDISRVADYLDKNIGLVGFIMSRKKAERKVLVQARSQLSKTNKIILFISDEELKKWVRAKAKIQQTTGNEISTFDAVVSIRNKYSDIVSS